MLTAAAPRPLRGYDWSETMRTMKSWRYLLAGLLWLGLLLGPAREARAEGPFFQAQGSKVGPWMFNLKLGGAIGVSYYGPYLGRGIDYFVLQIRDDLEESRDDP